MSFETRGTVVHGEVRLRVPFEDGTEVTVEVSRAPGWPVHKMVGEMTREEFNVWFKSISGSCPDIEEPPDPPPEPLDWKWTEE